MPVLELPAASANATELQPGETLDHYLVEALVALGVGDLGLSLPRSDDISRRGHQGSASGAESDGGFLTRFAREAEIFGRLDHPSIVKVVPPSRRYMVSVVASLLRTRVPKRLRVAR